MSDESSDSAQGGRGVVSDWAALGGLDIPSGRVLIGDYSYLPDVAECIMAPLPKGCFALSYQTIAFGSDERTAAARLTLSHEGPLRRGHVIGETWTDTGKIGICDAVSYPREFARLDVGNRWAEFMVSAEQAAGPGAVRLDPERSINMYFFPSGFGDGTYPVYSLFLDGRLIGLEIEFISEGATSPF